MNDAQQRGAVTLVRDASAEPHVLGVYARLIDEFGRADIGWCYWKSGRRVTEALAGKTDLDILVGRASQQDARRILLECGFRLLLPVAERDELAVECYLAHDEPSGRIAHVDLHTRLALGSALLKTHWLPWEEALIRQARPRKGPGPPTLDDTSEAVLLVVRASLELRRFDPVVARRWSSVTGKFAADRARLAVRVDREEVRARAAELLDGEVAAAVAAALFDPRPLQKQHELLRRVRRNVARFRTRSVAEALLCGGWRALRAGSGAVSRRLHQGRPSVRRIPGGGPVIAVIGVDGAGKSTLVRGLSEWLGAEVDVLTLYFGTGDGRPSWFLAPLKALVPLASMLLARKPRGSSHGQVTDRAPGRAYGVLLTVWATVLALEKRVKLRAARRAAARGMVVIADRFPQDEVPDFNDGPLLPRVEHVPRWLRAFEASSYALARALRPDLVIKLAAPPELIAARERTMDPRVIRARTAAMGQLMLGGATVATISASQPVAEVLCAARIAVWRSL